MMGHGARNQFRRISDVYKILRKISSGIEKDATMLYFGDYPDKKHPDIGYAHKLLSEMRPDIHYVMIQINEAKDWGVPEFVDDVYWHNDYPRRGDCKWGGFTPSGKPCSNTAKWAMFHNKVHPITRMLLLGGGEITKKELSLATKLHIPTTYIPIERRFRGDKTTRIKGSDPRTVRFGVLGPESRSYTKKHRASRGQTRRKSRK